MKSFLSISTFLLVLSGIINIPAAAQKEIADGDSLVLPKVISTVIASHPTIKEAEEAMNVADARINLARSGYMPDVDVSASYSHVGPVPSFEFPDFGKVQLFPSDNYAASLNYRQTLYDFGKTSKNIKFEQENKNLFSENIELAKQRLALATVSSFYSLVFLQEAIRIKDEEIKNLQDHLNYVQKKQATGSATSYEVLSSQVRLSTIQGQRTDLQTMLISQRSVMNSLLGLPPASNAAVKQTEMPALPALQEDSLLEYAYSHRLEMIVSKEKETLAGLQYNTIKSQNNPVLSALASAGGKNGYVPELNKVKANYSVGLGLRIPIFDGNRLKNNLSQVKSSINTASMESDITKRNITNEVIANEANLNASRQKISQFELQLNQAREAYKLAQTSYQTGAITNMDLLDAETRLAESSLQLLKAKIDYSMAVYQLKTALGDRLY